MRHFFYDSLKRFLMVFVATLAFVAPTFAANLPAGYTELEYIESTGTQYIDTGYQGNQNSGAYIKYRYTVLNGAFGRIFGTRINSSKTQFAYIGTMSGTAVSSTTFYVASNGTVVTDIQPLDTNIHTVSVNTDNTKKMYFDGNLIGTGSSDSFNIPYNVRIFCAYNNTTYSCETKAAVYEVEIYDNGALTHKYIPARRDSDGAIGMYDIKDTNTANAFRNNAGTGTFTAGPMACPGGTLETRHESGLPVGYTKLDYIQSTGTQYIDTGYFFTDIATETVTIDFMRTGTGAGTMLYGTRTAYKDNGYGIQFQDSGKTYIQYGEVDSGLSSQNSGALNTRYTLIQTGPSYNFNGGSFTSAGATPTQSYQLYLFGINNGGSVTTPTPMRVYSFVIKNANNVEKLHLVPAKNSSNVVGMYDTVSGTFFTNQGTGDFTAGNTVSDPIVEQCVAGTQIKIATTKYTEDAFAGLMTTLSEAITKVTNIVDDTVQQATEIGNLATTKQDRPDTDCPAGRKCLLIMGADNKPHWYLIQE